MRRLRRFLFRPRLSLIDFAIVVVLMQAINNGLFS